MHPIRHVWESSLIARRTDAHHVSRRCTAQPDRAQECCKPCPAISLAEGVPLRMHAREECILRAFARHRSANTREKKPDQLSSDQVTTAIEKAIYTCTIEIEIYAFHIFQSSPSNATSTLPTLNALLTFLLNRTSASPSVVANACGTISSSSAVQYTLALQMPSPSEGSTIATRWHLVGIECFTVSDGPIVADAGVEYAVQRGQDGCRGKGGEQWLRRT
jgi:hypothetical protein